jgi:hypothetical protein
MVNIYLYDNTHSMQQARTNTLDKNPSQLLVRMRGMYFYYKILLPQSDGKGFEYIFGRLIL